MPKHILIPVSSPHDCLHLKKRIKDFSPDHVSLCPINAGLESAIEDLKAHLARTGPLACDSVDFVTALHDCSFEAKELYLTLISRLGNKQITSRATLKEYFENEKERFSYWWMSLVFEKSPGKSHSFLQFCRTFALLKIIQDKGVDLVLYCDNKEFKNVFDALKQTDTIQCIPIDKGLPAPSIVDDLWALVLEGLRVVRFCGDLVYKAWRLRGLAKKETVSTGPVWENNVILITAFPFYDAAALKKGEFKSTRYGSLQDALDESVQGSYSWLAMYNQSEDHSWSDSVALAEQIKETSGNFRLFDEWIGLSDVFWILWKWFKVHLKCMMILPRLRGQTKFPVREGADLDGWALIRKDFLTSFAGKVSVENIAFVRIFSKIVSTLPKNAKVVYFAEMHSWEKALQVTCQQRPDIRTIGLQHTIVPKLLLNYFTRTEDMLNDDLVLSMPRPHYLGCTGRITQDMFTTQGWPQDRLFLMGGFRFQGLVGKNAIAREGVNGPVKIIVPMSICPDENLELLRMLADAFCASDEHQWHVLIKSHPCEPIEKMMRKLGVILDPDVFVLTSNPLEEIIDEAHFMVAGSTSSVFYALVRDIPIIVPYFYNAVDLNPLTGVYDEIIRVKNSGELKNVAEEIIKSGRTAKYDSETLLKNYFSLPVGRQAYAENLNRILLSHV